MSALFAFCHCPVPRSLSIRAKWSWQRARPLRPRKCPPKQVAARLGMGMKELVGKITGQLVECSMPSTRCMVLRSLSLRYHCLGENVLANTLPSNPTAFTSKRKWETAIRKARETLRLTKELAVDMEPGALRRRLDDIYLHRREHVSPNLPQTQPVSVEIRP